MNNYADFCCYVNHDVMNLFTEIRHIIISIDPELDEMLIGFMSPDYVKKVSNLLNNAIQIHGCKFRWDYNLDPVLKEMKHDEDAFGNSISVYLEVTSVSFVEYTIEYNLNDVRIKTKGHIKDF